MTGASIPAPDAHDSIALGRLPAPAEPPAGGDWPEDRPRRIVTPRSAADRVFRGVLRCAGVAVLVITGLIALFLILRAGGALRKAGPSFFTTQSWIPAANRFGIAAVLPDGAIIAIIALAIAVPVALGTAVFISEYAPVRLRRTLIAVVDLMAAVPSIIYGLWGVFFLQPRVIGSIRWVAENLGFIPVFRVRGEHTSSSFTTSTFIAGLVVSLMVIPIIASICREVFSQAPVGEREAAYALGANRWGMVRTVVLPYGRGGIIGATMLGFGRAMGETIAIALIVSPTYLLATHIFENSGMSIAALIALRYQESTPEMLSALMAAGLVLFLITLLVNALASIVVSRSRSGAETE
ncbi:phosphate ABC transporter permease subunit PstC [Rugosimonospora africana]|uniref:Phosphate transport system permease protein n=1 Tax=Rugosimonospora africana TaxID=556532 RepID=A0A8J3QYX9_9ACTN|nr:phosphate ABC transporter permease subunit PstC [Rugosimonospora africana]GIH19834.1 phosphate transport system permease protein [Rugosimonospora africana]